MPVAAGDHDHSGLVARDDFGSLESEAGIAPGNDDRMRGSHETPYALVGLRYTVSIFALGSSRCTVNTMAYPNKIDSRTIMDAAFALLEREGEDALTLRRLARDVGVTANALYRYFSSRDMLIAAAADAVAQRLYLAIEQAMAELPRDTDNKARVRKLLEVYSGFAERNPTLYRIFLGARREAASELPHPRYHELLWPMVVAIVEPLTGADDAPAAAVTLWGLLHGIWSLRQADVLGGKKPSEIDDYAFDALIQGLRALTT